MKHPPKNRKSYGKSLRRIAQKLGMKFVKIAPPPQRMEG